MAEHNRRKIFYQILFFGKKRILNAYRTHFRRFCFRSYFSRIADRSVLYRRLHQGVHKGILEYFCGNQQVVFFQLRDQSTHSLYFGAIYPKARRRIIKDADRLLQHEFSFFGNITRSKDIEWHKKNDEIFTWPLLVSKKISFDDSISSDPKYVWEISRFMHFPTLGISYHETKDEKYVREVMNQFSDWVQKNPIHYGIHWSVTLEVAIRVSNWIVTWQYIRLSTSLTEEWVTMFLNVVYEHGKYIFENLERFPVNQNHYLGNLTGLLYIAFAFPEFDQSGKWKNFGMHELFKECRKQFREDGSNFESSIPYHRFSTELVLYPLLLMHQNNEDIPKDVLERVEKMLEFVAVYMKPNGFAPILGDNDDGRLHIFSKYSAEDSRDHRYLLEFGAFFFPKNKIFQYVHPSDQTFWVLPNIHKTTRSTSVDCELTVQHFQDAGLVVVKNSRLYVAMMNFPHGQGGRGGHHHNDNLSFEVFYRGKDFFVDSGMQCYLAPAKLRQIFRSTRAHSTVVVDGGEMNEMPSELFTLHNDVQRRKTHVSKNGNCIECHMKHDGYKQRYGIMHHRLFRIDVQKNSIFLSDSFYGSGRHRFEWNYILAPGVDIQQIESNVFLLRHEDAEMNFVLPVNVNWSIVDHVVAYHYGEPKHAKKLTFAFEGSIRNQDIFISSMYGKS